MNWQPKSVGDHNTSRWALRNIISRDARARMKCTEEKRGSQIQGLAAPSPAHGHLHAPFSESVMTNFQSIMDPHTKSNFPLRKRNAKLICVMIRTTELNEDGDIIMADLDNVAIASKIARTLEGERSNGISTTPITVVCPMRQLK